MIKNKLVAVLGVPAGAVWLIDNFVTNMPHVLEGGVFAAGIGATLLGVEGCKKLVHSFTAPTDPAAPAAVSVQEAAPEASFPAPMTVHQLPPAPRREDLLKAYQMGAQAAMDTQRIER